MNPWVWRLFILGIACALLPLIVEGTAGLVIDAIHGASQAFNTLLRPLYRSGDARMEGLIKLSLYVIFITLLVRFLFERRNGG